MTSESTTRRDPEHGPASPVHLEFLAQPADEVLESTWCLIERDRRTARVSK